MGFLGLQLVGRPPFNAPNHFMLVRQIQTQEVRLPDRLLGVLSASCVSLITGLLKKNPVERISFEEFFNHPFLNASGATPSTTSAKPAASTDSMSSCQSVQTGIADRPPLPSRTSTDASSGRGRGARSQTPPEERLPFAVDDWVGGGRTVTMEEPQYSGSAPSSTRIRATLVTPPSTRFALLYGTPGQSLRLGGACLWPFCSGGAGSWVCLAFSGCLGKTECPSWGDVRGGGCQIISLRCWISESACLLAVKILHSYMLRSVYQQREVALHGCSKSTFDCTWYARARIHEVLLTL
jgi:hypothetical protein